ncbi:MAG: serine/threonine protein kinase [Xanthomonadales bacterium]|nr:serine/threonine protein kinase [Xanthomonadales bacterium]
MKAEEHLLQLASACSSGKTIEGDDTIPSSKLKAFQLISRIKQSFNRSVEQPFAHIQPGDRWAHFEIERAIGSGGMGQVFSAQDTLLKRQVAIKFLHPHAHGYVNSEAFIEEAQRIAKIRHPNVLAIFGANTFGGVSGFWSELLTGKTIEDTPTQQFIWPFILKTAQELIAAISEVHKNGMIHGDIKPQNVILEPQKGAVLMDFGSGHEADKKVAHFSSSTPLIMAPELFDGQVKTEKSDIYALGVLFFYLSSAKDYPHNARTMNELGEQVKKHRNHHSRLSGPQTWRHLVQSMLHPKPQQRPKLSTIQAVLYDLEKRPLKRIKRLVVTAFMMLLIGIAGTVIYSNVQLKSAQHKTESALAETQQVNQLMHNMLSSASSTSQGKNLLLIDALEQFAEQTLANDQISDGIKAKTLSTFAHTINSLGNAKQSLSIIERTLALKNISPLIRAQQLNYKSRFMLRDPNNSKSQWQTAKHLLSEARTWLNQSQEHGVVLAEILSTETMLYETTGQHDLALQKASEAITLWNQLADDTNKWLNLGLTYDLKGNIYTSQNMFELAESNFLTALDMFHRVSDQPNSNTMGTHNNLAIIYDKTGQAEKARDQFKILLDESEQLLGTYHPSRFRLINNYAISLGNSGQAQEALQLLEKHLPDLIEHLGADSLYYFSFQTVKAQQFNLLSQTEAAEQTYLEILKEMQPGFGDGHYLSLLNRANLAELYIETSRPQLCLDLLAPWILIAEKNLGFESEINLQIQELYAWSLHQLGKNHEALPIMQKVVEQKMKSMGSQAESTQTANNRLEAIISAQ